MGRRRVYEEDHGFVWHIIATKGPPKVAWYKRAEAYLNKNEGVTAAAFGLISIPFLLACAFIVQALSDLPRMFVFLLSNLDAIALSSIVIVTLVFAAPFIFRAQTLRGMAVVMMMAPGLMLTTLVLGAIPRPDVMVGIDGATHSDYVIAFIAGLSEQLSGFAPILPFMAFLMQILGLSLVQKLFTDTAALTDDDGALAKGSLAGRAGARS